MTGQMIVSQRDVRRVIVIDLQAERFYGDCHICGEYKRLDHAVPWCCGPTHDPIGSMSTEQAGTIVGGMCVCKGCHDEHERVNDERKRRLHTRRASDKPRT